MNIESLLKPHADTDSGMPEGEVEIPGKGTVRVRGLSRYEVMLMRKATDGVDSIDGSRALVIEQAMLSMAMVEPPATKEEVAAWQKVAMAGELEPIVNKVQELSGMLDDAPKSGV